MAGVHWRSDGIQGILLGEKVALLILNDYRQTYNENFGGFSFTKFDGTITDDLTRVEIPHILYTYQSPQRQLLAAAHGLVNF